MSQALVSNQNRKYIQTQPQVSKVHAQRQSIHGKIFCLGVFGWEWGWHVAVSWWVHMCSVRGVGGTEEHKTSSSGKNETSATKGRYITSALFIMLTMRFHFYQWITPNSMIR